MTYHHVIVIGISLLSVVVCGAVSTCQTSLHDVITLATIVVSGTLGNAGMKANIGGSKSPAKKKPGEKAPRGDAA